MRIAIYSSPIDSIIKPTGVGRHVASMAAELARSPGVDPLLLANRRAYARLQPHLNGELGGMPVRYIPGSDRLMRALLMGTNLTGIERWAGEVDWVYCPKEQPVATRGARLAVTVHDVLPFERGVPGVPGNSARSRLRWRLTMQRILRRADLIATVSQFTRGRLLELFDVPDPRRIHVVGNGVAPLFFRSPQEEDLDVLQAYGLQPQTYVLTVGSLTHRKNGPALLRLAERLHAERSPIQMLITGRRHDADLLHQFQQARARMPHFPMRLLGYVPDNELAVVLTHALAMLFPSRYEGFGIPVLEAMAAGAPVISSRAGALPEVIGGVGLDVTGDDEEEMAHALARLQDDPPLRADLVRRGRQRAAEFTWQRCASRLLTALENY